MMEGRDNRVRAGIPAALPFMTKAVNAKAEVPDNLSADIK